jgi:hypothetical protein
MDQYVYMLIRQDQICRKENIYKIGRTCNLTARLKGYTKGSYYILTNKVDDNLFVENAMIKKFKEKFIQRHQIGTEYFEGDLEDMKREFEEVVKLCAERLSAKKLIADERGIYKCECGVICTSKYNLQRHLLSKTHELNLRHGEHVTATERGLFECKLCNYSSSHKGNFRKHIFSAKHIQERDRSTSPAVSNNEVKPVMLMEVIAALMQKQETLMQNHTNQSNQQLEIIKTFADRILAYESHQKQTLVPNENAVLNIPATQSGMENTMMDHSTAQRTDMTRRRPRTKSST